MRTLEQNRRPQPSEAPAVQGQDIDKVNSEITEILKMERNADNLDIEGRGAIKHDLINKYLRAIFYIAQRDGRDMNTDPTLRRARELKRQFMDCEIEEVVSIPQILDGRHVNVITIESDRKTMQIVPDENWETAYQGLTKIALLRWFSTLSKIASELSELLAPEVNLHKDLAHDLTDVAKLKDMAATRGRNIGK